MKKTTKKFKRFTHVIASILILAMFATSFAGLGIGMLLFMMIPIISPLDATIINVVLSLVGGIMFSIGLGAISNFILKKIRLI